MPQLPEDEVAIWRAMFDLWRESYYDWPYENHQRFYNVLHEVFPDQQKYDASAVGPALIHAAVELDRPLNVWELGGWDGALAKEMIETLDDCILYWLNEEICRRAVINGWHDDAVPVRYYAISDSYDWAWNGPPLPSCYDIAILSHVIEHLSYPHLQSLLKFLDRIPFIYIQTPASMGGKPHPTNWMGTMSTHKLEVGWGDVYSFLKQLDYAELWQKGEARFFCKEN